jgi:hypothetical protein
MLRLVGGLDGKALVEDVAFHMAQGEAIFSLAGVGVGGVLALDGKLPDNPC